jgi:mono/diheme cytochrome c family protein
VSDSDGPEEGRDLYQYHCALCHTDAGEGNPPAFPALSGNSLLKDPVLIVRRIRQGAGAMPAFPNLTAREIGALADYIRNSWANDFGDVSSEDVSAALAESDEVGMLASVWDGVFSEQQAQRGLAVYPSVCGRCHGRRLNGAPDDPDMVSSPPLARAKFIRTWEGRSLATLFEYTRATMPESNPGSLSDGEYADLIAYMLSVSGMPAGDVELEPNPQLLARVVIEQRP